jgi:hypothetical protein
MELKVDSHERNVLLGDLDEFVEGLSKTYRDKGHEWGPYDPSNPHNIATLVRARDDLKGEAPPWHLKAPRHDLEQMITRLRAGASKGLTLGGERPVKWLPSANENDPERTDWHLDILNVCDALLDRLRESEPPSRRPTPPGRRRPN